MTTKSDPPEKTTTHHDCQPFGDETCGDETCGDRSLQACMAWQQLIHVVALRIRQSLELSAIFQTAVNEVHQLLGCDRVFIYRFGPDRSGNVVAEAVSTSEWSMIDRVVQDSCVESSWLEPCQDGRYVAIEDVATANLTPCQADFLAEFHVSATLAIPILQEETLWGLLIADHCQAARAWQPSDIEGLQLLAVQGGIAIQQATLMEQLQQAQATLETQVAERTRELVATNARLQEENQHYQTTEAALEASEQRLHLAFEGSGDGLWDWNIATGEVFLDDRWLAMLGFEPGELEASVETWERLVHPDDWGWVAERMHAHLADPSVPYRFDYRVQTQSGQWKWIANYGKVVAWDEQGNPIRMAGTHRDISDRKQAEAQLQKQAAILQIFYETSPLLMGVVEVSDDDILHRLHNPTTLAFFGVTPETLDHQWASHMGVPPEHIQLWLSHYWQSQACQQPIQFAYEHTTPTQHKWLSAIVSFLGIAESGRSQFSYIVQDITERKQLEAERQRADAMQLQANLTSNELKLLEQILDIILAGYWDWDIVNQQQYLSPGFKRMFGYEDHELPNSPQTWQDLIFPEDLPGVFEQFERHTQSHGAAPYYNEVRYRHKDGSTVWVICSGQVIEWDDDGNPLRMIGCHIDITERKQVEVALQKSEARWQFALEGAGDGLWDWDIQTNQLFFSRQWKTMLGYEDDEIRNSLDEWNRRLHPDDKAQCYADLEKHFSGESSICQSEYRLRCKDGSYKWILDRGKVLEWGADGQPLRMIGTHTNISDRKRAEAALRQSEATNRALIQAIPDFLVRMRQDGMQMEVINIGNVHCLQPQDSSIEGNPVWEIMPISIAKERMQLAQQAIATGETQKQEYTFIEGSQIYYEEARISALSDSEVLVMVRDISDRKRGEAERKRVKEQLELVLKASSEGFWDWDFTTNTIYFSPRWKEILGYADHELDNTLEMWASVIVEEDRVAALQLVEDYNSGKIDCFEAVQRFHHKEGSIVYVLSRAIHLKDVAGNVIRMVGSHLDMTETIQMQEALKLSKMQLSGILNSSLDGIMAFHSIRDPHGNIVDFEWLLSNPASCEMVGRSAEALVGQRMLVELPGNREEGLFDSYVQVVELGEPSRRQFYYNHDGIDCWFENIAVKLGDGFAVTFRDISEQVRREQSLKAARTAAESANRAKSEFLANMSHEIRTPMNAVLGFTEILQQQTPDLQSQEYLRAIASSGKTLLALINDILDLSKIEAGRLDLYPEPISIGALVRDICTIFSHKAASQDIVLNAEIADGLPPYLMLDEVRLRQILFNVVGNALKFTETGAVNLFVTFDQPSSLLDSSIDLQIIVQDTGIGIVPEQQAQIFDAFTQIEGQRNRQHGGTGLGLAITRRLVDLMGGTIHLESEFGQGSTFTFTFPQVAISAPEAITVVSDTTDLTLDQFAPARILIADDVASNRDLLAGYFRHSPHSLNFAVDGEEAVRLAQTWQPDVILMDLRMPRMDGLEAARHIRSLDTTCNIPILVVTASSQAQDETMLRNICNGFVRKPMSLSQLVAALKPVLPGLQDTSAVDLVEMMPTNIEPVMETGRSFQPLTSLSPHQHQHLMRQLGRIYTDLWQPLQNTFAIQQVETFAEALNQLVIELPYSLLVDYTHMLNQHLEDFDWQRLPDTIMAFSTLIDILSDLDS